MYATMEEYQALERVIDQLKAEFAKKDSEIADKQATIEALRKTNNDLLSDLEYYSNRVFELRKELKGAYQSQNELIELIDEI